MSIQLTPQQQQMLDGRNGNPPRLIDPRTNAAYVLVPEADFAAVQEAIEDERRLQAIQASALRNAIGRMDEAP